MKTLVGYQPGQVYLKSRRATLGHEPAQQCMMDDAWRIEDAFFEGAVQRSEKTFGGEKRHLRVIRDRANPTLVGQQVVDTARKAIENVGKRPELDLGTKGISDRPAKEAGTGQFRSPIPRPRLPFEELLLHRCLYRARADVTDPSHRH